MVLVAAALAGGCPRDVVKDQVWPPPVVPVAPADAEAPDAGTPIATGEAGTPNANVRPTAPTVETRVFHPNVATPEAVVVEVRTAMENDRLSHAIKLAEETIPRAKPNTKSRLHWLAARAAAQLDNDEQARLHWAALTKLRHPLSRWATYYLAGTYEWSSPETAAELAGSVNHGWTGAWRARVLEARALFHAGKTQKAKPKLAKLLTEASPRLAAATIAIPLANIYEREGDLDNAADTYARVADFAPGTEAGRQAREKVEELRKRGAKRSRKATGATRTAVARADALYRGKKYKKAERAYLAVAKKHTRGSATWCHAMEYRGRAMLHRRERTKGAPAMERVANLCPRAASRPWSRFRAGRAYSRTGRWDKSIAQHKKLQQESPSHSLADDAAYRIALVELERGRVDAYRSKLKEIPKRYPNGDMWEEALFRLGWDEMRAKRYDSAFEYFDELVRRGPKEVDEGMTGRAAYWRARMLQLSGQTSDAASGYAQIAMLWPLRYYAQLSIQRLGECDKSQVPALLEAMKPNKKSNMVFAWRPEFDEPGFEAAVELMAVQETTLATLEMKRLRMVGENIDIDLAILGAMLLERARAPQKLTHVIRNHFQAFRNLMPNGDGLRLWEVAYPLAYKPMIEQSAKFEKVPASLVRAIAREESSFNPDAVSWAKAYGLVQLILPTAKRFSKGLGVKVTPRTLMQPRINLRIGARFMAWLRNRFEANEALVPAAYNAGEGAVRRWLAEDSKRPLDVFVEEIPYDETRRYTRRVLQSYGVYTWLAEAKLPQLPEKLPRVSR